jgi:hypothetical protein
MRSWGWGTHRRPIELALALIREERYGVSMRTRLVAAGLAAALVTTLAFGLGQGFTDHADPSVARKPYPG